MCGCVTGDIPASFLSSCMYRRLQPYPNLKSGSHPLPHSTATACYSHCWSKPSTHRRRSSSTTTTSLDQSLATGSSSSTRCRFVGHHTATCALPSFSLDVTCGQGSSSLAGFRVQQQGSSLRLRLPAIIVRRCCRRKPKNSNRAFSLRLHCFSRLEQSIATFPRVFRRCYRSPAFMWLCLVTAKENRLSPPV